MIPTYKLNRAKGNLAPDDCGWCQRDIAKGTCPYFVDIIDPTTKLVIEHEILCCSYDCATRYLEALLIQEQQIEHLSEEEKKKYRIEHQIQVPRGETDGI